MYKTYVGIGICVVYAFNGILHRYHTDHAIHSFMYRICLTIHRKYAKYREVKSTEVE